MNKTHKRLGCLIIFILCLCLRHKITFAATNVEFDGNGTKENPYLITDYDDLCSFRDLVNQGNEFKNVYFQQTEDLDLKKETWTPIGIVDEDNYFYGVYDGAGHTINNLFIPHSEKKTEKHVGFFGTLGGTVVNLGIESGSITGDSAGGIANRVVGEKANIINCYNKATIIGYKAAGIAADFSEGVIAACWDDSEIDGEVIGGLIASGGDVKIYGCFTTNEILLPEYLNSQTSYIVPKQELYSKIFVNKLNLGVGLTQYLFANNVDVKLLEWKLNKAQSLVYSESNFYINMLGFINNYLLTLLMLIFILFYVVRFKKVGKNAIWVTFQKQLKGYAIISGIISLFLDIALLVKGIDKLNWGNGSFILLSNLIFLIIMNIILKNSQWKKISFDKKLIPLLVVIVLIVILELSQFNLVPKYDATLYYGSFINGIDLFNLDLFTYIGAFVCWKWANGLALFLAPFEFLIPGEIVGVYIANIFITVITMCILYRLMFILFSDITPFIAAMSCAIFMFLPYGLGLFTYLCMDWHLVFFGVWLLYAIVKNNNILICFCGYLLAFTKITGLVFYALVLISLAIIELIFDNKKSLFKRLKNWWKWDKIVLWILPAIVFLATFFYGDHLTIQNFLGSYNPESIIDFHNIQKLTNTFMQAFVFGFRWVFIGGLIIAFIIMLKKPETLKKSMSREGIKIFLTVFIAFIGTFLTLCIINSDAQCPRYTAIFNIFYALAFPLILEISLKKVNLKRALSIIIAMVLLIQTYWTIDPSLIYITDSIDTGKKNLYKLALPNDPQMGMNIGKDYGIGYEVIGDLYTYNLESSFYDDLLEKTFTDINPSKNDVFYVLDILDYELHTSGSFNRNYKIFWDSSSKKRTYNGEKKENLYLDERNITTEELCSASAEEVGLPNKFYLFIIARVDGREALDKIKAEGYIKIYESHPENIYGKMSVYGFER